MQLTRSHADPALTRSHGGTAIAIFGSCNDFPRGKRRGIAARDAVYGNPTMKLERTLMIRIVKTFFAALAISAALGGCQTADTGATSGSGGGSLSGNDRQFVMIAA